VQDTPIFDCGAIAEMEPEPLIGMAPKRRDPTQHAKVQTFIRKHGAANLPFGHTLAEEESLIQSYIAKHGLTKIPMGTAMTAAGKRSVEPGEQEHLRDFRRGIGETKTAGIRPVHRAPDAHREQADAFEGRRSIQASPMSLRDEKHSRIAWSDFTKSYRRAVPVSQKLPAEGTLAERSCSNPECMLPIGKDRHKDAMYCPGYRCRKRHAALKTLDKIRQASLPATIRRTSKISCASVEVPKHTIENTQLFRTPDSNIISPHIFEGVTLSKDHLIGRLLADRAISFQQYEAALIYGHDNDDLNANLRAPPRDALDFHVWRPREPVLITRREPYGRVTAANRALGSAATVLVQRALLGQFAQQDLAKLRAALDALGAAYDHHQPIQKDHPWMKQLVN
jgi:hypothetical protein